MEGKPASPLRVGPGLLGAARRDHPVSPCAGRDGASVSAVREREQRTGPREKPRGGRLGPLNDERVLPGRIGYAAGVANPSSVCISITVTVVVPSPVSWRTAIPW